MSQRATLRATILLALAIGCAMLGSASADEPKGIRWVGPDVLIYAESTRPEVLLDRTMSPRVNGLLQGVPGYKAALARTEVMGARAIAAVVAAGLGTTWEKGLREIAGGGIVAAVEGKNGPERLFLIVTPKDFGLLERTHTRLLEFVRSDAKNKKKPDPVAVGEHSGIKIYSLAPTEAHAIVSGTLVVANGTETLKVVIDRTLDSKSATIADDPIFQSQRKMADPEAFAWAFARTDRLRTLDPKRFGADAKPDPGAIFIFGAWLEAIMKGDWAAGSLAWTDTRAGMELSLAVPKGGYSPAMKRYLPVDGGITRPFLPKNAIASGSLWRDFSAIWEVRTEIFTPETVQGLAQLDTQAGTFFGGRDFGTGVLGALGARWNIVIADQDFDAMEPKPDTKLPALAVILDLKPDDPEFATRLMAAFQSFLGLVNLGAAQTKAPPLMIISDSFEGLTIATSKYQPVYEITKGEPVSTTYNFTPSAVQVGNYFVISSNLGLARELTRTLKETSKVTDSTLLAEASGAAVAKILERNRDRLVVQNMLSKGNAKAQAEAETSLMLELLKYAGKASLSASDRSDSAVFKLNLLLDAK